MRPQCLSIGEAGTDGQREYTFKVEVNRQPLLYHVRARTEYEAQDQLKPFVEATAASMQELGALGGTATVVIIGAVAYAAYVIAKHIKVLVPKATPKVNPKLGDVARPFKAAGFAGAAAAGRPAGAGAPRSAAGAGAPRSAAGAGAPRATAARPTTARRTPVVNGATASTPDDDEAPRRPIFARGATPASRAPQWRPLVYKGYEGRIAGGDPAAAIRVVVFSDAPVESLLSLVRPSAYDPAHNTLKDAIVVMSFPAKAAAMRAPSESVEVMIGDGPAARDFDVTAATPEEALTAVRNLLADHL